MNEKNEQLHEQLNQIYEEGYHIGNAGMPLSYLPYKYKQDLKYAKQWEKGWRKGNKEANRYQKKTHPLKWIFTTLIVIIALLFIVYQNQSGVFISLPTESKTATTLTETMSNLSLVLPPVISTQSIALSILENDTDTTVVSIMTELPVENPVNSPTNTSLKSTTQMTINAVSTNTSIIPQHTSIDKTLKPTSLQEKPATEKPEPNIRQSLSLEPQKTSHSLFIEKAGFAKNIIHRNPVEMIIGQTTYTNKLFFYTKFNQALGKIITHSWYFEDTLIRQRTFKEIKGNSWRLFSEQSISPDQKGHWSVKVTDKNNHLYIKKSIIVQ